MLIEIRVKLAASDIERARRSYAEKLGLTPYESWPEVLRYKIGQGNFSIHLTPTAGTAKNTVAVWGGDLRAEVVAMRARGVVFDEYYVGDARTVDGIVAADDGTLNAWFQDLEGHIMALAQTSELSAG